MLLIFGGTYHSLRNLDDEPELAKALGNMAIAWSNAEDSLKSSMQAITGMSWKLTTAAFYRIPTFESRTKVICAMLEVWETPTCDAKALGREIIKLAKLSKTRNGWIHGSWSRKNFSHEIAIFDYRQPSDSPYRLSPIKFADVLNHIEAVLKRADRIREILATPLPASA